MKKTLVLSGLVGFAMIGGGVAFAQNSGETLYNQKCASCHGADGHGKKEKATMLKVDPETLDFTGPTAKAMKTDDLRKITADGKGKMPAYGKKLTAEQLDAVTAYVEQLRGGAPAAK